MAVGALPSWQREAAADDTAEAIETPSRLAWPVACVVIGGLSAVLWSLVWGAVVALVG